MLGEYTKEDGYLLLKLAKEAIEQKFTNKKPQVPNEKQFRQARGVFVTIHENEKLRGCVGFPYPEFSLCQALMDSAKSAAFSDPRFLPLKKSDLSSIKIEISILSYPEDVKNIKDITTGKDGLICTFMGYSGLLLPQVASKHKMSKIQFLEALCSKAGLPNNTWQNKNFKLKKFSCQIFKED